MAYYGHRTFLPMLPVLFGRLLVLLQEGEIANNAESKNTFLRILADITHGFCAAPRFNQTIIFQQRTHSSAILFGSRGRE